MKLVEYSEAELIVTGTTRCMQCCISRNVNALLCAVPHARYKKIQVANARVPVAKVEIFRGGAFQQLVATIDNYHVSGHAAP